MALSGCSCKPAARRRRTRPRSNRAGNSERLEDGFVCKRCHVYVSMAACLSGVQNRNHCPYCLWSRHLDLVEPGDRLSACKALMRPIGLTVKAAGKKYAPGQGELMLIHLCVDCGKLSINRIAADDLPGRLLAVFEDSFRLEATTQVRLVQGGIRMLAAEDGALVNAQLFGRSALLAASMIPV